MVMAAGRSRPAVNLVVIGQAGGFRKSRAEGEILITAAAGSIGFTVLDGAWML